MRRVQVVAEGEQVQEVQEVLSEEVQVVADMAMVNRWRRYRRF